MGRGGTSLIARLLQVAMGREGPALIGMLVAGRRAKLPGARGDLASTSVRAITTSSVTSAPLNRSPLPFATSTAHGQRASRRCNNCPHGSNQHDSAGTAQQKLASDFLRLPRPRRTGRERPDSCMRGPSSTSTPSASASAASAACLRCLVLKGLRPSLRGEGACESTGWPSEAVCKGGMLLLLPACAMQGRRPPKILSANNGIVAPEMMDRRRDARAGWAGVRERLPVLAGQGRPGGTRCQTGTVRCPCLLPISQCFLLISRHTFPAWLRWAARADGATRQKRPAAQQLTWPSRPSCWPPARPRCTIALQNPVPARSCIPRQQKRTWPGHPSCWPPASRPACACRQRCAPSSACIVLGVGGAGRS